MHQKRHGQSDAVIRGNMNVKIMKNIIEENGWKGLEILNKLAYDA